MRIGLLFILFLTTQSLLAQERCATIAPATGEFENWVEKKIQEKKLQQSQNRINKPPVYEIPIVIHVLHRGEVIGEGINLSNERIKGQIDSLNADFRRTNADAINTPAVFQSVAADVEIQFVLAKQDPSGNPTSGIIRKVGERNSYSPNSHTDNLRSESYWPPENYLNIYVVDLISFLGFASFPNTSLQGISFGNDDNLFDGVLIDYQYFGVNPEASSFESYGRTLTHEMGHFLGLRHIWGDGGCGVDDFVNDTPPADNDNGGLDSPCTFPNLDDGTVCETDEMFQNYMDYTDDICMNLFTSGQKTRMRTVMENSPRRVSLTTSLGLTEPTRFENDLAITKIISPKFAECEQEVIPEFEVSNYGTNEVTSFEASINIDGQLVNTARYTTSLLPLENQIFSFPPQDLPSTPFQIEINSANEATDGNEDNNQLSKIISFTNSVGLPYYENFESSNTILGRTGSTKPWEVQIAPNESAGNQALKFKAFQNTTSIGDETMIKTPIFNLSGFTSAELNFSYSHAALTNGFWDGLAVKVSTDCGQTFEGNQLFSRFGNSLSANKESSSSYIPSGQNDWQNASINITSYAGMDGVQFAFVGVNGSGNNIYLDDIEVIQTDLNENDISPIDIQAPLVTCKDETFISFQVRNVGFQNISSFQAEYTINNTLIDSTFSGLSIGSGQFQTFRIVAENLIDGENTINLKTTLVNNQADDANIGDSLNVTIIKNTDSNEFPLKVNFETADDWSLASINSQLWQRTSVNGNSLLKAEAFDSVDITSQSWFVSPVLSAGGLDSAGLYFRASYASRQGFNDQLEVRISVDCGESYGSPILIANSDSLASFQTSTNWQPTSDNDWKEYRLDLSTYLPFRENIRIAFVFTNGGGNNLYIDDISIRSNEEPVYKNTFRAFPNPATTNFNVGLNLNKKEKVVIQLMDMTGKIIFEDSIDNALNQIRTYSDSSLSGLYFIRVIGEDFVSSQKIFFNRN
ncbi:MAG: choice-of-anchor J domain-containing protein [Ekhidna sp.]